jgi:beta-lactamase class A
MKSILIKKVPLYIFLIAIVFLSLIIYHLEDTAPQARREIQQAAAPVSQYTQAFEQVRLNDYDLTKPLLMTEVVSESENLMGLKRELDSEINQLKLNGTINDASVYLKRLNDGEWISVNNTAEYAPGSIIKIATTITYLKMCELNPKFLTKEYYFAGRKRGVPVQTFNDDAMVPGNKYSAKDLLTRVIVHSDNDATQLINDALNLDIFKKLFTDLNIPEPDVHDPAFKMDVGDLSKFMRILYNATYLTKENSEFVLSLLSQSSFNKGIVNGLPPEIKVAHKFGETGTSTEAQLHETAIVYIGNDPYLITIMTKGKNVQLLPAALSGLSRIAYEKMKVVS